MPQAGISRPEVTDAEAALSLATRASFDDASTRIKCRMARTALDIIEIGRDLIAVKQMLGHGRFLPWIDAEFGMSEATALRFTRAAELSKSVTVTDLPPAVLYALAAPSTPDEVRTELVERVERGDKVALNAETRRWEVQQGRLTPSRSARADDRKPTQVYIERCNGATRHAVERAGGCRHREAALRATRRCRGGDGGDAATLACGRTEYPTRLTRAVGTGCKAASAWGGRPRVLPRPAFRHAAGADRKNASKRLAQPTQHRRATRNIATGFGGSHG